MEAKQILQANILEIIFEGKNKAYGAYYLRKTYHKRLTTALIVMISLLLFTFIIYIVASHYKSKLEFLPVFVPETDLQKIKAEEIKVLPTPKMTVQHVATIKFPPPVIVKDKLVVEPPPEIKQLEGWQSHRACKGCRQQINGKWDGSRRGSHSTGCCSAIPGQFPHRRIARRSCTRVHSTYTERRAICRYIA